jgi:uncharacterized damage-inducible protein DinB
MKPRRRAAGVSPIGLLLEIFDEAYDRKAWHGPNLRGSVRRLSEEEAAWRPSPERHNVWETVLHAAYWKYAVRRRLTGGKRGSFPAEGSNWFERPDGPERRSRATWKNDLALLDDEHRKLREVIAELPVAVLAANAPAAGPRKTHGHTIARLVYGIAAHDTYHAGQIRLLLSLRKSS